jgi:predicted AlkP superfamily phosphohydrolase/phosphomutase
MKPGVVAIGLDAANPRLLERWMAQGYLPNLARFCENGAFGDVRNVDYYRTETSWITFLTGALPAQTGEWGHVDYDPANYKTREHDSYAFRTYPPFYALLGDQRVAVFDPPLARLQAGLNGVQVLGWGTEANQCLRTSQPAELIAELIGRHGAHPMFEHALPEKNAAGEAVYSYSIPSSYDLPGLHDLRDRLVTAAHRRGAMMQDLLERDDWDLFLGVFAETHTASHLLWHLSQQHPLQQAMTAHQHDDPLRDVFQAVDAALGKLLDRLPDETPVVLFSIYGIGENVLDLPSMAFLPELLYRWSHPGQALLQGGPETTPRLDYPGHWKDEIWQLRTDLGDTRLESPARQRERGDPMHWQPANWYRRLWPEMQAFALPTYSEGLIRLNISERDPQGRIPPGDFGTACDALCDFLHRVHDHRSGKPMVDRIIRTRQDAFAGADAGPPADLIVLWQEDAATDWIGSPDVGDIGPMPFFRSGGHCSTGFLAMRGPQIAPGARLPDTAAVDLTATLLWLLGKPVPAHIQGHPVGLP